MPNYINTITMPASDTAAEAITAIINALVTNLDWVADDDGIRVWTDASKKIGMTFSGGSQINCYVCNNIIRATNYFASINFQAMYCIDYVYSISENSLAVGFRATSEEIRLTSVYSNNSNDEMCAIFVYGNYSYMLKKDYASILTMDLPYSHNATNVATSLCKLPDIIDGCMFDDLYCVFSCPVQLSDLVIYIGGQYYRICGNAGYSKVAFPVG